jgi:translation elongation factor EF-Tu-like GTPase
VKSIIVGTAGHIDHGKTALVKTLTGIDADRLEEEKRRGITIDPKFGEQVQGGRELLFGLTCVAYNLEERAAYSQVAALKL